MGKKWYTSKTVGTGVIGVVAGLFQYLQSGDLNSLGTSVMGALMIALRVITKQPLD